MDKNSTETHLVINDIHAPYYDDNLIKLVLKFARILKPDYLVNLGDSVDMPSISQFDRSPERYTNLGQDFKAGYEINGRFADAVKDAKRVYTKGNHCFRFEKYIMRHPEISGAIDFEAKIGLKDFGYKIYEYGDFFKHNDFLFTHGHIIRKHSGYTAKAMLDEIGTSGISGHTHRASAFYKTDLGGEKVWVENGCLCDFDLAYQWFRQKSVNWNYAISVITFHKDKFHIDQIVIPRKHLFIIYGNKYYT